MHSAQCRWAGAPAVGNNGRSTALAHGRASGNRREKKE